MKAIICFRNGEVHISTFGKDWTPCQCGNVRVRWIDPDAGTVVVAAHDQHSVRLLGMNNAYLVPALGIGVENLSWEAYQHLHSRAVEAPGYLFNKDKVACWAAVVRIGRSNDVRWATPEESEEAFAFSPALEAK